MGVRQALEHDEVIEVPMQDCRPRHIGKACGFLLVTLRIETEVARGLEEIGRFGAVARNAASARRRSSGIQAPKWASTMASETAPHSTASIWRIDGTVHGRRWDALVRVAA